jgi:GntR family transcriptional regulator/MocR family aminotransferase
MISKKQTTFSPNLLISLKRKTGIPLCTQLTNQLRDHIRSGSLPSGMSLPASRLFAQELSISRSVVVDTYEQLAAEGYVVTHPRSGTRVAPNIRCSTSSPLLLQSDVSLLYDFRPGIPDTTLFPRTAWMRATNHLMRTMPANVFIYGDACGPDWVREEISHYLNRVRGTIASSDSLVLCSGFTQGFVLFCQMLCQQGIRRIAMEDPSHPDQRILVARANLDSIPIPVDEKGLRVDLLAQTNVQAVLVSPAHQFPTGVALAPERRSSLIEWAQQSDSIIIEDDYDAEYRYDRNPIGALQGIDPEHVVYIGSTSKMIAPALRIGWLVVPERWRREIASVKRYADLGSPVLNQMIFAHMLANGDIDRYLRKARQIYRSRRDVLVNSIDRYLPDAHIQGVAAGLHVVIHLSHKVEEEAIVAGAALQRVGVYGIRPYYAHVHQVSGLVLGYAALPESSILAGMQIVGDIYSKK